MSNFIAVVIPYAAALTFLAGMAYRVLRWAASPVPFRIPATCGQQKSLNWIRSSRLDNPHSTLGAAARMALEILLFRSLFRNTRTELASGAKLVYGSTKWLWLGSLAFHWSLLIVGVRHLRFFMEPQPTFIGFLQGLDGFFQVGIPVVFATDGILLAAGTFLLLRRLIDAKLRYISLAADYFPLVLLASVAITGILMRHVYRVDLQRIKTFALGLVALRPSAPDSLELVFYIHLLLASVLIAYVPFSKLMHMGGIFLSPTRNLANNSRRRRHVNPWNHPVTVHSYQEYEDEFREVMAEAGLPLDTKNPERVEDAKSK